MVSSNTQYKQDNKNSAVKEKIKKKLYASKYIFEKVKENAKHGDTCLKPGTLEAEDRLLHSKTMDRHPRKRREKGRRKREIRRRSKGRGREEKNTQSRGTCAQTTYLGRNLHLGSV